MPLPPHKNMSFEILFTKEKNSIQKQSVRHTITEERFSTETAFLQANEH